MPVYPFQSHRRIGKKRIQFFFSRELLHLPVILVPSPALYKVRWILFLKSLHAFEDFLVAARSYQIYFELIQAQAVKVTVGIDKPGDHRLALCIHQVLPLVFSQDIIGGSDSEDASIAYGQGFGLVKIGIDGVYICIDQQQVCLLF